MLEVQDTLRIIILFPNCGFCIASTEADDFEILRKTLFWVTFFAFTSDFSFTAQAAARAVGASCHGRRPERLDRRMGPEPHDLESAA